MAFKRKNKRTLTGKSTLVLCLALGMSLLPSMSCFRPEKDLNLKLYIQKKNPDYRESSLLILNFIDPSYAPGVGAKGATVFHKRLLDSKKFLLVKLINNSDWTQLGNTEEEKIRSALKEGKRSGVDFVLAGRVTEYKYGGLNQSLVRLRIRVIQVSTGITFFLGEYGLSDIGSDRTYSMNTRLSDYAEVPEKMIDLISQKLVAEI